MKFDKKCIATLASVLLLPSWMECEAFTIQPVLRIGSSTCSTLFTSIEKDDFFLKTVKNFDDTDIAQVPAVFGQEHTTKEADFPRDFIVTDKWSFLQPKQRVCELPDIPTQVAFQCVNKRGAIAHGRDTELNFDVLTMDSNPFKTVKEVFDDLGGTKVVEGIVAIKQEIMNRGPVVSTSFFLTGDFMSSTENANRFDPGLVGQKYPVLIVGWEHTAFGEVWNIQPLVKGRYLDVQKIAFRQFGIDEKCLAPTNNFNNTPWQSGPYFDVDMSDTPFPEWCTSWSGVETNITSQDLENLGDVLGEDFINAEKRRIRFVIRDRNNVARSRACCLTKVKKEKGVKPWLVEVSYAGV